MSDIYDKFKELIHTDRVRRLRKSLASEMTKKKKWWGLDLTIMDTKGIEEKPLVWRKALAQEKLLLEMPIKIDRDEIIAGEFIYGSLGLGSVYPQYATEEEQKWAQKHEVSIKSVWGHSCPDIARVLSKGLKGLRKEIDSKLIELNQKNKSTDKQIFLRAIKKTFDNIKGWTNRYSRLALKKAKAASGKRKEELLKIAEICKKVPEYPPESFHEAVQSMWFIFAALHNNLNYVPIGRVDYMLYPFLKKDLDERKITLEKAQELIDCLWMKFNKLIDINVEKEDHYENHHDPGDLSLGTNSIISLSPVPLANYWMHNVTLGGSDQDDNDAFNLVTYMCLEASHALKLLRPNLYIRISSKSPEYILKKCAKMFQDGLVLAVLNDDVIIDSLLIKERDIPSDIARTYSADGCWEPVIPGKTEPRYGHIESLLLLELTLNRGYSRIRGGQEGLDLGDPLDIKSYEELLSLYKKQLDNAISEFIKSASSAYYLLSKIAPTPLMSVLMDNCVEKVKDLTEGGAYEVIWNLFITGIADTADSLAAIKKFVFEEKRIAMEELLKALENNFTGYEVLRYELINRCPKYGNNDDYVDAIAKDLLDYFIKRVKYYNSKVDNINFLPGAGTFERYKLCGELVGATPNGRRNRDDIAVNLSSEAGMNMKGPTSLFKSYAKMPLSKLACGAALDVTVLASTAQGEKGVNDLTALLKTFIDMGGLILSVTVTSAETLRKAQKNPEKYKDLMVRMGGWQAYFVALDKKHQDNHIQRAIEGQI